MLRILTTMLAIAGLISSCSHAPSFRNPASAPSYEDVLKEVQVFVKNLDRGIYTYHYAHFLALGAKSEKLSDPAIRNHVKDWSGYFWDRSQDKPALDVQGLYLAADPSSSRDYTGTGKDFALFRVELPEHLRILDVSGRVAVISSEASQYLIGLGCDMDGSNSWSEFFWHDYGAKCRDVQLALLKALDVDAIKYTFNATSFPGCLPYGKLDSSAFILLRVSGLNPHGIRVFLSDPSQDDDAGEERGIIRGLFRELNPSFSNEILPGHSIAQEDIVQKYKVDHLLNCQNLLSQ